MNNFVVQKPDYDKKKLCQIVSNNIDSVISSLPLKNFKCIDDNEEIEINGTIDNCNHNLSIVLTPHSYFINVKYSSEASEDILTEVLDILRSQIEML